MSLAAVVDISRQGLVGLASRSRSGDEANAFTSDNGRNGVKNLAGVFDIRQRHTGKPYPPHHTMLGPNDLKPGTFFVYQGQPYEVLETHHLKMQQRRPVVQTRMRNLLSGKQYERNFAQSDLFEEADIQRQQVKFLYAHRDEFWFSEANDSSKRFQLSQDLLGDSTRFLKPNTEAEAIVFDGRIINVELPIKLDFRVVEAPPAIRGNTAQGGVKSVKLETGTMVNVPLFVNEGDIVRVNTQTGEYTERVDKK